MTTLGSARRWQPPMGTRRKRLPTKDSSVAPFDPLTLTGLAAWYETADPTHYVDAGSGHVSTWYDLSGNTRDLTQSNDTKRPVAGTRTQNSRNVFDFIPANVQWMQTAADFMASGANPVSMAVVAKCDETGVLGRRVWSSGTSSDGRYFYRRGSATGEYSWNAQDGDAFGGAWGTAAHIITGTDKNGVQLLRSDGVQIFTNTKARNITNGANVYVGIFANATSDPWDGWMGELLLANAEWSGTELTNIETYLNAKWAVF